MVAAAATALVAGGGAEAASTAGLAPPGAVEDAAVEFALWSFPPHPIVEVMMPTEQAKNQGFHFMDSPTHSVEIGLLEVSRSRASKLFEHCRKNRLSVTQKSLSMAWQDILKGFDRPFSIPFEPPSASLACSRQFPNSFRPGGARTSPHDRPPDHLGVHGRICRDFFVADVRRPGASRRQ